MNSEQWQQIKECFREAIDRPSSLRESYLQSIAIDDSIRDELRKLVSLHQKPTDFLEPLNSTWSIDSSISKDPIIGMNLGGFKILRQIGSGGMGVVYEAHQESPDRMAAVKVMHPTKLQTPDIARFRNEAEIQSRLNHSGIAQIYACGTCEFGMNSQSWFAMELVHGEPLDEYCRTHSLKLQEKLNLFLRVCDAVQNAHEHGVIHRDLKPANILIESIYCESEADHPTAIPKIVDFGLAKKITPDRHANTLTQTMHVVGTLSYMSPERFGANIALVDHRCDLYALGVIGFELLTDHLPHPLHDDSFAQAIQRIQNDEPELLGSFDRRLRGDLEVIFAKSLERDPANRFRSVEQFAADIRRFQRHEPIVARKPTWHYRCKRFVQRNPGMVAGILSTIFALSIGLVLAVRQSKAAYLEAAKSKYEADKAIAVNNFMTNDFMMKLLAAAANVSTKERVPVSDIAKQASLDVQSMYVNKPLQKAAIRNEIGTIFYNLSEFELAIEQYRDALRAWEQGLGPNHPDTLKAVHNIGQCYMHLNHRDEARAWLNRALEGRVRILGNRDPQTLLTMNNLAVLLQNDKKLNEAESMFRSIIAIQKTSLGEVHKDTLTSMSNLGTVLIAMDRKDEALALHQTVQATAQRTFGQNHPMALHATSRLAQTLLQLGKPTDAESLLLPVQDTFQRTLGDEHTDTIIAKRLLARVYRAMGKTDLAKQQIESALESLRRDPARHKTMISKLENERNTIDRERKPND